jgi:hypothetical protein
MNNLTMTFNLLFAVCQNGCRNHIVKVPTRGEFGTPGVSIPEGHGLLTHGGKQASLPFSAGQAPGTTGARSTA